MNQKEKFERYDNIYAHSKEEARRDLIDMLTDRGLSVKKFVSVTEVEEV